MSKLRHEWYQTDSEVVLSVFIRNAKPEDVSLELTERSLSLSAKLASGVDSVFDLEPLAHTINPAECSHRVLAPKIEIKLKKRDLGVKWADLEGSDHNVTSILQAPKDSNPKHSYPSSSKKNTNWDALAKNAAADEEKDAKEMGKNPNTGGDKALNELFQKLYADATDDQRKAMIKSYQESNGTSLSTNWDEVSKGKVETKPPDSMVAKKWEQ